MRFCIILGAMKAGTTSLFRCLAQHPQIAPCSVKEPSFASRYYDRGRDWFLSLWKGQNLDNKILLTASTNCTKYPDFPESSWNILDYSQKFNAAIKFLYIMRDPIARIESHYTYSFARWTSEPLEARIKPNGHLVNVSRYALQLDQYTEKFDRKNFLLLDFDELRNNPAPVLAHICRFLEIDDRFQFANLGEVHNKSEGTRIVRPVERLYLKYPRIERAAKKIPLGIRSALVKVLFRRKIKQKFRLTDEQEQKVRHAIQEDMNRLRDTYGIDVSKWGF